MEYEPTHFTYVDVPQGTMVREGISGKIPEWGVNGGGYQVQLLEKISESFYQNPIIIEGIFQ